MATLPIAEIFCSPQGEGYWAGTLMVFVRLAGCTVGKPYSPVDRKAYGLQVYQERCTSWQGTHFACDTNYKLSEKLTPEQIMQHVGEVPRICLTGGEPLMHSLDEFLHLANKAKKRVHVETSGTYSLDVLRDSGVGSIWVAVSPKYGYLKESVQDANEVKVLVDADFDERKFLFEFGDLLPTGKVWLQPINEEKTMIMANVQRCLELQMKYPTVRLSTQLHKLWGVR